MSTRSLKKDQSGSGGGAGAGLVSVDHVARSSVASARSSPGRARRISITRTRGTAPVRAPRSPLAAGRAELLVLLERRARIDRTDVRVLVERISDAERRHPALQLRDHGLRDRFLDEEPRAGTADVALVEVDPVDDPFDRLIE